jgi:hypothetical protein
MESKPCNACPWTSKEQRDKEALTDEVKKAAASGAWFCCHVHMGTCYGAQRYAGSKPAERLLA